MARRRPVTATAAGFGSSAVFRQVAAAATLAAASAIAAAPAEAQARVGGQVLYKNEVVNGTAGYGARVDFDIGFLVEELVVGGTYERLSPECDRECAYWEGGGQVGFHSGIAYLGLGLFFSRFEKTDEAGRATFEDDWDFALIGGARFPIKGFLTPFLELRSELGEGVLNSQTVSLGILLGPYGRGGDPRNSARTTR